MLNRGASAAIYLMLLLALIWGLWVGVKQVAGLENFILPWPQDVFEALVRPQNRVAYHVGITLWESVLGFLIANAIAFLLALLFQLSAFTRRLLMPLAIGLKTTPVVAIAPLLLIWFGPGIHSKVIASSVICFFPLLVSLYEAMAQTPRNMVEYFESLGASKGEIILRLRLPYAVPEAFAALKVSSTLAVVGAVVGEFVGARAGLGYLILTSSYQFQTPLTFAGILMTCVCGGGLFLFVMFVERLWKVERWRS